MKVVTLYAGLLALLFVVLSVRTLRMRRRLRIAIGDGSDQQMLRAMRVHSNFAEYVPFSLLLLYLVEETGASPAYMHALGAALLIGRLLHAIGVSQVDEKYGFRIAGMALTFTVLIAAAARLLHGYAVGR